MGNSKSNDISLKGIVEEYRHAIKSEDNLVRLMGHQPTLQKIRDAYHTGEIDDEELEQVLQNAAKKLQGRQEPFKSTRHMLQFMFGNTSKIKFKQKVSDKSKEEQKQIVSSVLGKDEKQQPKKKKSTAKKKSQSVDVSKIPENLRKYVNQ